MCLDLEINILWILEYTAKRRDQDVERYISCDFLDLSKCKVVAVQRLHFPIPSTLHQAGKSALALDMVHFFYFINKLFFGLFLLHLN